MSQRSDALRWQLSSEALAVNACYSVVGGQVENSQKGHLINALGVGL